ncbi:hypothetical protein RN001_008510 [Aquatica leii]|uniref:YqaJ viral recombinase domain-containing protein n=1 Tax=Aquatica leii TaxID=1421715 RepID=A0AAN7SHA5_9COLE|nr:hypothetical protein RN001_008510 [Aquatica leii]
MHRRNAISSRRKLKFSQEPPKKKRCVESGPDMHYGLQCSEPDMPHDQLEQKCKIYLQKLQERFTSHEDQQQIEKETRGQHENIKWREIRQNCLTASNFGTVIKRRPSTHCHNLVKRLLYGKELNTASIIYGRTHECEAIKKYETVKGVKVTRCGIFVDIDYPYLAASPDGLVAENGLLEVKCLPSLGNQIIKNVTLKRVCFTVVDGEVRLNPQHPYYFQVQRQLNITKRDYCDFVIFTENDFAVNRIYRDVNLWNDEMLPKLISFYTNCMLPEIIDGRVPRGLKIRDPQNDTSEESLAIPLVQSDSE